VAERDSNGRPRPEVPIGGRLLEGGARGVGRIAGATGIDRTVEVAVEEAIVRALESAAVERAITRLIEDGRLADAVADSLDEERLEETIRRAIDSEVADRIWEDILASDKAQMLVERIAEAPEVRVALASQGVGLMADLGRQISRAAAAVDGFLERTIRRLLRRPPRSQLTDHVGLAGRGDQGRWPRGVSRDGDYRRGPGREQPARDEGARGPHARGLPAAIDDAPAFQRVRDGRRLAERQRQGRALPRRPEEESPGLVVAPVERPLTRSLDDDRPSSRVPRLGSEPRGAYDEVRRLAIARGV